jgi:hypothetical protein
VQAKKALEWKARTGTAQEIQASEAEVDSLSAVITQLENNISKQTSALGINAKGKLAMLRGNTFLHLHMNSLTLQQRIIQNLAACRFEMENLECLVRYSNHMGEYYMDNYSLHSLTFLLGNHDHTQLKQGLNRRKGGNEWLVKAYKKL